MDWSKKTIVDTPLLRKTIPFSRFMHITRFLHFADNNTENMEDKIRKVIPVVNYYNKKFQEFCVRKNHGNRRITYEDQGTYIIPTIQSI